MAEPAQHLWEDLDRQERELKLEGKRLREIWHKINDMHRENAAEREEVEKKAKLNFRPGTDRIVLNVGGQQFETTAGVLCRDRFSILAALCKPEPEAPLKPGPDGVFFIDRDWWIFRHILYFLRTDALPDDQLLLEEMYNEANFYRLSLLRAAIEDRVPDPRQRLCDERYGLTHQVAAPTGALGATNPLLPDPYGFSRELGSARGW